MNRNLLNILSLISLGSFLLGNITYDLLNHPTVEQLPDVGLASGYWVYIPMAICFLFFTTFGMEFNKKINDKFYIFWWFFNVLSISQCVKIILFNPFVKTINDWAFLVVAICGLCYKFYKLKRKSHAYK